MKDEELKKQMPIGGDVPALQLQYDHCKVSWPHTVGTFLCSFLFCEVNIPNKINMLVEPIMTGFFFTPSVSNY